MAAMSYGKRMLKAGLQKSGSLKKAKTPDQDAEYFCLAGFDKDGFTIKFISDYKGFGLFACQEFQAGDFLLQYTGEKITVKEANIRMKKHSENKFFFYSFGGKQWCIDGEASSGHICQYANDAPETKSNSVMKLKVFNDTEYLCLFAKQNIKPGEEIVYNYGDGNNLWWRKEANSDSDPFEVKSSDLESESYVSDSEMSDTVSIKKDFFVRTTEEETHTSPLDVPCLEMQTKPQAILENGLQELKKQQCKSTCEETCILPQDFTAEIQTEPQEILENGLHELKKQQCKSTCEETCILPQDFTAEMQTEPPATLATPQKFKKQPLIKSGTKPERYCVYCKQIIKGGKLRRHIKRNHKVEEDVKEILKMNNTEQNKFFDKKRREGIYEYNLKELSLDQDPVMRERKPKHVDEVRVCSECKSFYSNKHFSKHQCISNKPQALKPKLLKSAETEMHQDPEFRAILNRFRSSEVGDLCRSNIYIQQVGYRHFNLRRHENSKQDEIRKLVMSEMRELSRLFLTFKLLTPTEDVTVESMFTRRYLQQLREAVEELVHKEETTNRKDEKHGLKLLLDAIILRTIKSLLGFYTETMQDEKYEELKKFRIAYKYRSNEMYAGARHKCTKNSQEKARRPANLPSEMELIKLKNFIRCEIYDTVQNFSVDKFSWLRTLIVSRLTLYNARRGEEPSRMLVKEWEDALADTWLPPDSVESIEDEAEKYLVGQIKLVYLSGKGKKYVPVLVPNDLIDAMKIICKYRESYGLTERNLFLFGTKGKESHCSGWHALRSVCEKGGVEVPINANKMRHKLSTIFASLDMSEDHRKVFLEHMGHSEEINKDNYQCPVGVKTVQIMGKVLRHIDEDTNIKPSSSYSIIEAKPLSQRNQALENGEIHSCMSTDESDLSFAPENSTYDTSSSGDDTEDFKPNEESRKSSRNLSVKWTKKDTDNLRQHFQYTVNSQNKENKGNLPSKSMIMTYLNNVQPSSLAGLSTKEQYRKTRNKIFNERKTLRSKVSEKLKKISV